jgi:hypothetical protein
MRLLEQLAKATVLHRTGGAAVEVQFGRLQACRKTYPLGGEPVPRMLVSTVAKALTVGPHAVHKALCIAGH